MTKEKSDKILLQEAVAGNGGALGLFYDRHHKALHLYLASFVGDSQIAADLLQDSFLALMKNLKRFAGTKEPRQYLFSTARNRALNALRTEQRYRKSLDRFGSFQDAFQREEGMSQGDALAISQSLANLPDELRESIVLKIYCSMTFEEMAEITGRPKTTLHDQYKNALEQLRTLLKRGTE